MNLVNNFITFGELNQSNLKRIIFVSSMTKWTIPKLLFPYLLWKTKWFLVWVNSPSFWLVWLFMVMEMRLLLNSPTSSSQMIQILRLGLCCGYFEPWKRSMLSNQGFSLNLNHKMHFFKDWHMEVLIVWLHWSYWKI
jgi:hypothetical protein